MPGGLLQLISNGTQDSYLSLNPEFTFFKFVYKKHTNFSITYSNSNFKTNFNFNSNNIIEIPKYGDLINSINLLVHLPQINIEYTQSKFELLYSLTNNLQFINNIEYLNLLNNFTSINNSILNNSLYNTIIHFYDSNIDVNSIYSNILKIYHIFNDNTSSVSSNIYYQLNTSLLNDNNTTSVIFNDFSLESNSQFNQTHNILLDNNNIISNKKLLLNLIYNNNVSPLLVYLNKKSNDNYKFNHINIYLQKLFYKLLYYNTNNDYNLLSYYLISSKNYIDTNNQLVIQNFDSLNVLQNNYILINTLDTINSNNILFICNSNQFNLKNIKSILIFNKNYINNNYLFELAINNKSDNFFLSNSVNNLNLSSQEIIYEVISDDGYTMTLDTNNYSSLEIDMILFGYNSRFNILPQNNPDFYIKILKINNNNIDYELFDNFLSAYNLFNSQPNTNDFDQSEITYLFNDNNILSPISYKIYYSDIWNNFEFLYNSNFYSINSLNKDDFYDLAITSSQNTLNNQKNILINIINSYFVDLLYVTLEFSINQSSLIVDDYIETNLNEDSFTSITNKFTRYNDSVYSINDSSYSTDKFVNKFLNIFFDTKDNFKIRINNSYSNIFTKNITNYSEIFNINNLISYFSQTTPFLTLKLNLTSDQTSNDSILFLDQNDDLTTLSLTINTIVYIYTTDVSTNYQINETEPDNFIGTFKITSIDLNNESLKIEIYNNYENYSDRLTTDNYLYLIYKDTENNTFYKLKCNNNFIDQDLLIINSSELNFIDFTNSDNGESTDTTFEIGSIYYLYEISNNNFNLLSANFIKNLTLSHFTDTNLYFYIDSSENFDYNFEFDKYSYFAFKYDNDQVNLSAGIRINSITFNSRFFNSNIPQYNNITDSLTRGYKYTNLLHIYLCLFLYDELKSNSVYLNNIFLLRLINISSKIFNLITSNSSYSTDLETLSGSIKLTFLADFSTIFNSNTIINELFDNSNNIFDSYFLNLKELLLNKELYEQNYDGNITEYQYIYDTTYYKFNVQSNTREEITDSNIITIITEYYSKTISNLYNSNLNSYYTNYNKELFYVAANDFVINEYLNIIDYVYYDDIETKISSNVGTHFFNIINNNLFLNRDTLNSIVESNILVYGNFHIIGGKNAYIYLLNAYYQNFQSSLNNFLLNEPIISNISNLDFSDNLLLSDTEIYNLFYTNLNLTTGDNPNFNTVINEVFSQTEINKSIYTFFNNMLLNNDIFNYINKLTFLFSIYQIYSLLPNFIKQYTFNQLYKYDNTIDSSNYNTIDDIFVPTNLYDTFITKINYIKSLSSDQTDIEKNIFNYQKTFLKNLKDVYFSDNSFYLTVKLLENQINNNDLLNQEYKFIRGSLVTNDEYDLLNYDPLICNITNINSIGSLNYIYITFDLNNIFFYNDTYPITLSLDNSTLQIITNNDPFPAENSLTSYNTNSTTYNINIKFQTNIKNVNNVIDNNVGISTNGVILKNTFFNTIDSNITSPDSVYKITISSDYYFDYTNLVESSTLISVGDTLNLYNSSLISSSNLLNISITVTDITDNIVTFSLPYNNNIDDNVYAMLNNDKGFKFESITVESFRLNLMYYFDELSNTKLNYSAHINENNDYNYYSGKYINSLTNITNNYFDNSNYNDDKLRHTNGHSKIIGISLDGYPIYGPYALINDQINKIKSSYKLKNTFTQDRINLIEVLNGEIINYGIGSFVEDYEYIENYGDLDEYNGRFCITPDFPKGTYAYFVTLDENDEPVFPYILTDKFYGSLDIQQDNLNVGLNTNLNSYNVNDNVTIIQNKAKYGTGVILSDDNNIKYISIINDGFNYQLNKCYILKDIPSTLEYVDKYRILIRRKSILGNGFYYDYDNNKLDIVNIGDISSETNFNNSFTNLNNLIIDIENMFYNNTEPILQIVEDNEDVLQILFLDEYINYLTILNDDNFSTSNLINFVNTTNTYINDLTFDMIKLLFNLYKQNYYLYYNNITIIKHYNLNNINLENYINDDFISDVISTEINNEIVNINQNNLNLDSYSIDELKVLSRVDNPNFNWIVNIGNYLLNRVELYMNDLLIDCQYSEWVNIWYELNNTYDKKELREKMIGSTYDLFTNNSSVKSSKNLIIPLHFWFNRHSGINLPVIAMSNVKMYLKLYIEDLDKLVIKDDNTNIVLESDLDIKLNIGFIYLDDMERNMFAKGRHEYLIEVTQYNEFNLNESNLVDVYFKNCVKDLIWFIDYEDRILGTYDTIIKRTKIIVNNTNLLDMDNIYTNYVIPYERYKSCVQDGVNVYSFNLSNNNFQPTGSLNFSMLDNVQFNLSLLENNFKNKKIRIFANSYNILKIMSGLAGLSHYE